MSSIYSPLDTSRRELRLLKIGGCRQSIKCELAVFALDDEPEYRALSYCWGTEPPAHSILINGRTFQVRPNLYDFLLLAHSSPAFNGVWIFIDAICINQEDTNEAGSQVGLMGDVYRQAAAVTVWLGVDNRPTPERLLEMQRKFDTASRILRSEATARAIAENPNVPAWRQLLTEFRWKDLDDLTDDMLFRPYWSRLWVIQELIVSQDATIYYNSVCVDCKVLTACLLASRGDRAILKSQKSPQDANPVARNQVYSTWSRGTELLVRRHALAEAAHAKRLSLSSVMTSFGSSQCSRRHDKVFGLLGLTTSTIRPDYETSLTDLYIRTLIEGLMEIAEESRVHGPTGAVDYDIAKELEFRRGVHIAFRSGAASDARIYYLCGTVLRFFGRPFSHTFNFGSVEPEDLLAMSRAASQAIATFLSRRVLRQGKKPAGPEHFNFDDVVDRQGLVKHVEAIYGEVLESKYGGRTEFVAIAAAIPDLATSTLQHAEELTKRIADFPTPREALELFTQAMRALAQALQDCPEESAREAEILATWKVLSAGSSRRLWNLEALHRRSFRHAVAAMPSRLPPIGKSWVVTNYDP